jgi:hypothetical protein
MGGLSHSGIFIHSRKDRYNIYLKKNEGARNLKKSSLAQFEILRSTYRRF